ncbi:MAG: HAMP domain-containing histidine kinase [bacterium]|nr:HAMP domain-containing histidine kinase [bacterium]
MKPTTITNLRAGLFICGILLIAAILLFSFRLMDEIRSVTRKQLTLIVERYRDFLLSDNPEPALKIIEQIDFPIILADANGTPLFWKNLSIASNNRSPEAIQILKKYIKRFDEQGNTPIALELSHGVYQYFHYSNEELISQLKLLTWLGIGAFVLLALVGYYGLTAVRLSESRAIWIGFARETAHQFGTPISGLMGWLELLQEKYPNEPILSEIEKDINRLRNILNRFSAMGRDEELIDANVVEVAQEILNYMERRLPQKSKNIQIVFDAPSAVYVKMRPELVGWVLENLLRNAADAIQHSHGKIEVKIYRSEKYGIIDVSDNGKGMTAFEKSHAFRTGYSTKTKGWGVGLSLSKRIIQDQHHGRIDIVKSVVGEGSTFRIEIPLSKSTENSEEHS